MTLQTRRSLAKTPSGSEAGLRTDLLLPYLLLRFSIAAKVLSFCLDFGCVRGSIAARLPALRAAAGLLFAALEVFPQGGTQTRNARCLLVGLARSDHGTVGHLLARRARRGAPATAAAMLAP